MNIEINPYIRRAWYDTLPVGSDIPARIIYDYELLYIKSGTCSIIIEDRFYAAVPGDIFLLRPGVVHQIKVTSSEPLVQPHIHFDFNYQPDSEAVPVVEHPFLLDDVPNIRSMIRKDELIRYLPTLPDCMHPEEIALFEQMIIDVIYAHTNRETFLDEIKVRHSFLQLLHALLYEMQLFSPPSGTVKSNTAQRIKMFLDHNNHRSLSLDEIADQCFVSKCHLVCVFREAYGITPHRYHQNQRINESKYLLRMTTFSISEIASTMGFEDIHAFSILFKRLTGISPTQYRNGLQPLKADQLTAEENDS